MKVLVLNYEFPPLGGGAAPVSKDISIQLSRKGHDVTVVTMGYHNLPAYEEVEGIKIYRLRCLRSKKSSCMPWEQYTYLLSVRHFMKSHLQSHAYDICHVHFVIPTGEVAMWIKKRYNIPYVITAHGSDVEGYNQKKYMKVMHKLLRPSWKQIVNQSEGVIAPSIYLKSLMEAEYNGGKYILIPNGLDVAKYKKLAVMETKEKRILLMGRMQKSKNIQMALKAISRVNLSGWSVDILGDGPYRTELENMVEELNLTEFVSFHGWIDNGSKEQLDYLQRSAVYITASYFENCPMSVLETIAAGCYPLLSDIPAHRQLIPDDEYYFRIDDVQGLADKIQTVINNREKILQKEINITRYDWNIIIRRYEAVLYKANDGGIG